MYYKLRWILLATNCSSTKYIQPPINLILKYVIFKMISNLMLKYEIFKIISKFSVEKNCIWINTQWGSWRACDLAMNCGNCYNFRRRNYCFCVEKDRENGRSASNVSLQQKQSCYNLCKGKKYISKYISFYCRKIC